MEEHKKQVIETCITHARNLLKAASAVLHSENLPNIAYHLSVLAIEEIGKAGLLKADAIAAGTHETSWLEKRLEDHYWKLFWAFWTPGFSKGKITKKEFEDAQTLAKRIHAKRLSSLYVSHNSETILYEVSKEEAENIIQLAEARLGIEESHSLEPLSEEKTKSLDWFLTATADEEKKKLIFSGTSLQKLTELDSVPLWIEWMQAEFAKNEAEMQQLLQQEMNRSQPDDDEGIQEKWKIKVRLQAISHSVRQKPLNWWNQQSNWMTLSATDKKGKELILEFRLPKGVHGMRVWHAGWGYTRRFLLALNIGSMGFFWWYSLNKEDCFYEEITDLENNTGFKVTEKNPFLYVDWGQRALAVEDLQRAGLCFYFLPGPDANEEEQRPFGEYLTGLAFLAKSDLHLNLTANACDLFFRALKDAMKLYGDWDESKQSFAEVFASYFENILKEDSDKSLFMALCEKLRQGEKTDLSDLTLDKVLQVKVLCDAYFLKTFQRLAAEKDKKAA